MTREEAKKALKEGHKITHHYFSSTEYIYRHGLMIYFEDGYIVPQEYWDKDFTKDGWSIYKENLTK